MEGKKVLANEKGTLGQTSVADFQENSGGKKVPISPSTSEEARVIDKY